MASRVWTPGERKERILRIERLLRVGEGPYTADLRWALRQIRELDKQLRDAPPCQREHVKYDDERSWLSSRNH